MTRVNQARELREDANHASRRKLRSRVARRERRPSWVRPLRRLRRALDASFRLIDSTQRAVEVSEQFAAKRPVRASRALRRASDRLIEANVRIDVALRGVLHTDGCIRLAPERAIAARELLDTATCRLLEAVEQHRVVLSELQELDARLTASLEQGLVQPEREHPSADRRPRIVIVPRPVLARPFLTYRRSTARDRIASVPLRRRPKAPVATGDAPRQISRGRAPPLSATCLLRPSAVSRKT